MESSHVTVLEVDLKSLLHNLHYFKSKLSNNTKILAVVKAFGYGSDATKIAKYLEPEVSYFGVAYLDEGIALRKAGIQIPIVVLHPQKENISKLIQHQLQPNIYTLSLLESFIHEAQKQHLQNYPIHLKFNTGLNRLGFTQKDIVKIASVLNNENAVKIVSVFSHIAASEDLNERDFTLKQIHAFKNSYTEFVKLTKQHPLKHMLNTSGIINYTQEAEFDIVRLGIGLYGFGNSPNETKKLQNVFTLKSVISQIHTIKKGETVGYNRAYKAASTIKTATIPIGHADGLFRQLGNGIGYVYIHNQKAPIIGNVCMDMIMVNISKITCNEGDEVVIYKNQNHIIQLSKALHTIPYELITAISQRVKRVIKK